MQIITRIVFPVMAVMALAGCSKDSVVTVSDPAPIAFRVLTDAQTKAPVVENGQLNQSGSNITIQALSGANGTTNFFKDTFTYSSGGWSPVAAGKYYWPTSGSLSFFAYYPADLTTAFGNGVSMATAAGPQVSISTVKPVYQASQQADLLVGQTVGVSNGQPVTLNMKHVLSQIEIKGRCLNPSIQIIVKGVKLVNIFHQAKLVFPTGSTSNTGTLDRSIWQNASANGRGTYYAGGASGTSTVTLTGDANASAQSLMMDEGPFMLIPQSNTAWGGGNTPDGTGTYIAVLCQIKQKTSNGSDYTSLLYPTSSSQYAYAAVGIAPDWQPGVKYTYTLDFFSGDAGGAGKVPPDLTDPSNPQGGIDESPTPGTSVSGGKISVSLHVATWQTTSSSEQTPTIP